jgi:hypothetical protein
MSLSPCPKCGAEKGKLRWGVSLGGRGIEWWVECHPGNDKPGQCRFAAKTSHSSEQAIAHWNDLERAKAMTP